MHFIQQFVVQGTVQEKLKEIEKCVLLTRCVAPGRGTRTPG